MNFIDFVLQKQQTSLLTSLRKTNEQAEEKLDAETQVIYFEIHTSSHDFILASEQGIIRTLN